ncbi:cobyrinate a,c-diamide synthase [Desulfosarcina sp. BuS5]|uniref:cobyrinate a,c-diamide synthase n=1 Tax=Desulfosarcina sp. BuS5 TaxID=933262 RepID=UPI001E44699F|nr:cobyrinate a,c-diamide synthase [Desulfosarcina sp. BuS5]
MAGTSSGCGKTTVTLALMAALSRQGLSVAPFKVGPDFIDPGHHGRITGKTSRNLDGWMLPREYNLACFGKHCANADMAIVEGVMGLFDGYDGKTEAGSTAQMAKWTGLPVILVVNAKSMAGSAAALVQGFERFDKKLSFAGVIFNNIGSERHLEYLREALENNVNMPCLGGIIRDEDITIPERHLGLVTDNDHPLSDKNREKLADLIEKSIDIQHLLNILPDIPADSGFDKKLPNILKKYINIGVARDNAFCFYYQDNLDMLQANGANLVFFSPINDKGLPDNLDGLYFGGGYPELFAEELSKNIELAAQVRQKSINGMPIYGECGGFMYLCSKLYDHHDNAYCMSGCLPFTTRMFTKLKALGYREISLSQDTIIGRAGEKIKGHEFHYSETDDPLMEINIDNIYKAADRSGQEKKLKGYRINNTLGSYCHLHFGSCPDTAKTFTDVCRAYNKCKRTKK